MKAPIYAYVFLTFVVAAQTVHYYPQLPDTVASHFDGGGRANGWASRDTFFLVYWGVFSLHIGMFLLIPFLLRHTPDSLINLPNKDYWLAEDRKEETLDFISRKIYWFGVVTVLLFVIVMELVIRTNLQSTKRLSSTAMWALIGIYLVYAVVWTIGLVKRFRKMPEAAGRL